MRYKTRIKQNVQQDLFLHLTRRNFPKAVELLPLLFPLYKIPGYDRMILQSITFIVENQVHTDAEMDLGRRILEQLFAFDPKNVALCFNLEILLDTLSLSLENCHAR